ncbi:hypothetical protein [Rhodopirellula halodulae]|uniref:hypothetical protein n=1 Tax=Rhodopirellula halodulae TaxID=2894198 RepID=UPI001E4584F6|nr:hypothetical protein [Rhodopirellula sp. JC737]MCC9657795.1 hypothetical protein [Rhodopirellula sp. JC737]
MSGKTIHELLELPEHVKSPHAYQVFGLQPGEANPENIHQAIANRIHQLKAAKSETSADVWSRAAQVVQTAQRTLTDPRKKSQLDARFGIVALDSPEAPAANPTASSPPSQADAPVDPLAALLPSASPTAANPPAPQPEAPVEAEVVTPSGVAAPVPQPSPAHHQAVQPAATVTTPEIPSSAAAASNQTVAPLVVQTRSPSADRARRRKKSGGWLMGGFLLLGFVVVGCLAAFFFWGPGEVQVVRSNDGVTIRTRRDDSAANQPASTPNNTQAPTPQATRPASDGIMKTVPSGDRNSRNSLGNYLSENTEPPDTTSMIAGGMQNPPPSATPNENMSRPGDMNSGMAGMTPTADPTTDDNSSETTMSPTNTPPAMTPPEPDAPSEATPEMIASGEQAIVKAADAIRQANWSAMKDLAEAAEQSAVTPEQKGKAETLYQIADLGTYYRGAVSRGMANLTAGNEFNITDSLSLLVVEADANQLIARRGARNYTYPLDEVPFIVAKALAAFQLPLDSQTGKAAKAVYESVATKSTPEVRTDAVNQLRSLDSVEGADPQQIANWIESELQ